MFPHGEIKEMLVKPSVEAGSSTKAFENASNEIRKVIHIPTINEGMEGKKHPGTDVEYRKHTFMVDGQKVEGVFPVFESKFDTVLPPELRKASDTEQFKYCTKKLAERIDSDPEFAKQFTERQIEQIKSGEPRISGLTWHHNEVPGKMQLVDAGAHAACGHTGGRSIWGGGTDNR